jgi:hypothetical protein
MSTVFVAVGPSVGANGGDHSAETVPGPVCSSGGDELPGEVESLGISDAVSFVDTAWVRQPAQASIVVNNAATKKPLFKVKVSILSTLAVMKKNLV